MARHGAQSVWECRILYNSLGTGERSASNRELFEHVDRNNEEQKGVRKRVRLGSESTERDSSKMVSGIESNPYPDTNIVRMRQKLIYICRWRIHLMGVL